MIARCTEEHRKNVAPSWRHREGIDATGGKTKITTEMKNQQVVGEVR